MCKLGWLYRLPEFTQAVHVCLNGLTLTWEVLCESLGEMLVPLRKWVTLAKEKYLIEGLRIHPPEMQAIEYSKVLEILI